MRRRGILPLLVAAALGLSACTAGTPTADAPTPTFSDAPGDEGQSAAAACAVVAETIDDATAAFSSASPDDPASAVAALTAVSDELTEASAQVTNDEVAALLPPFRDAFTRIAGVLQAIAAGETDRIDEVADFASDYQEAVAAYEALCDAG